MTIRLPGGIDLDADLPAEGTRTSRAAGVALDDEEVDSPHGSRPPSRSRPGAPSPRLDRAADEVEIINRSLLGGLHGLLGDENIPAGEFVGPAQGIDPP